MLPQSNFTMESYIFTVHTRARAHTHTQLLVRQLALAFELVSK